MTAPDIQFRTTLPNGQALGSGQPFQPGAGDPDPSGQPLPKPIMDLPEDVLNRLKTWLDWHIREMKSAAEVREKRYVDIEKAYRARPEGPKVLPFEGASNFVVPVIAMAVDPVHARLENGIFKQSPVFTLKGLKKSFLPYANALQSFIDFNVKNRWKLRQLASPRILEYVKLGTMVFKVVYVREVTDVMTYDDKNKVVKKQVVRYVGPKIHGVSIGNFYYPAGFENTQDCPILVERHRSSWWKLKQLERRQELANVDSLRNFTTNQKTALETEREDLSENPDLRWMKEDIETYECWFEFDISPEQRGITTPLMSVYELNKREFLRLQPNFYFNQQKPFTVIPYTRTNGDLSGLGVGEMLQPFQDALSKWIQAAEDNAYLANIRMFIAKKESGIERVPRLYPGRTFFVDDPSQDFIPFRMADTYPSTLTMQQNLFGLAEKRTGISDYLTGRESPIVGTRATATSTLALIQEGTQRVEQVLENMRHGFSEIIERCISIWIQFGIGDIDDLVFGDDEIGTQVKEFFTAKVSNLNADGAFAIDLSVTDAAGSRQAQQQMQLAVIQVMMMYLEKVLAAGQSALTALTQPVLQPYAEMVVEVMKAAKQMFNDLLQKYDIRNADDYLPDLARFINVPGTAQPTGGGGMAIGPGGTPAPSGVPAVGPESGLAPSTIPQAPPGGNGIFSGVALAGPRTGAPVGA